MKADPVVSVVIPAYNPRFFRQALVSVIEQTYHAIEIMVCDDSADERIFDIVESLRDDCRFALRYQRNPQRLGFVGNLLKCLESAQGEFIKFMCDDDVLTPLCVAAQAQTLYRLAQVNVVTGRREYCDAEGFVLPRRLDNSLLAPSSAVLKGQDLLAAFESWPFNLIGGLSSVLMRRAQVAEYLPVLAQTGFKARIDFALYACLLRRGELAMLDQPLCTERRGAERLSAQAFVKQTEQIENQWLNQMILARGGEDAPAVGWARFLPLGQAFAGGPWEWEEIDMRNTISHLRNLATEKVGSDCDTFAQLYRQWLDCRTLTANQRQALPRRMAQWSQRPTFRPIIVDAQRNPEAVAVTLRSLATQSYAALPALLLTAQASPAHAGPRVMVQALDADPAAQFNQCLQAEPQAGWVYLLNAGDRLQPDALLIFAERINACPELLACYSDEGALVDGESAAPCFKPDFNLDLMRSCPYVGANLLLNTQAVLAQGGFDSRFGVLAGHDALWRLAEQSGLACVGHVAELLVETAVPLEQWLTSAAVTGMGATLTAAHLGRLNIEHHLGSALDGAITAVTYRHDTRPRVSIIVSVKDQVDVLQACIETVLAHSDYPQFEILLVDQASTTPAARAWFDAMRQLEGDKISVVSCQQGGYAAAQNQAVERARGEYVVLLSADLRVSDPQWLEQMLAHAQRPEVAAVGVKVIDPAGRIASAGAVLGLSDGLGLPFQRQGADEPGYLLRLQATQNCSALREDCLMVRRSLYRELGGLIELDVHPAIAVADLCLKLRSEGSLLVWTPHTVLQRADSQQPQIHGTAYLLDHWLAAIARDPSFNPNLDEADTRMTLRPGLRSGWNPFVKKLAPTVLAFPINKTAVGHYRVTQPFSEMEAAGRLQGMIRYGSPSVLELERFDPDVIVTQCRYNEHGVQGLLGFKHFSNARRIYELDDYVIAPSSKNDHIRKVSPQRTQWLTQGIAACDRLVVSTQALADALDGFNPDIRVVPNMLAPSMWQGLRSRRQMGAKPRVGWGGGTSHRGDLEMIAEVVRLLANEVEWVFFGMCPDELRPYIHEFVKPVGLTEYPARLASLNLDLALAPLELGLFNDCKSNLRLLEYGACGYPVIATMTRAYDGYLPFTPVHTNTTEEWIDAIRMHLADPAASYRLGDELRTVVLRDYLLQGDNIQHWVNGWLAD